MKFVLAGVFTAPVCTAFMDIAIVCVCEQHGMLASSLYVVTQMF